jgi:hypothetical protein
MSCQLAKDAADTLAAKQGTLDVRATMMASHNKDRLKQRGEQLLSRALLRACPLFLRALFLGMLFRQVMSDDTAANRPGDRVMSSIVPGNPTHDRALDATGCVCRSNACEC